MDNRCLIYVEQLRNGHTEVVDVVFPAEILGQCDEDLRFVDQVKVAGEAYLAEQELILHFDVHAQGEIPCAICNADVVVPINLKGFYHAEPLEEVKTGTYNFIPVLREALILEAPRFVECNDKCTERESVSKYLKEAGSANGDKMQDDGYQPFADLDLK
ncbi:MAG: hypothetical protein H7A37_01885 [Chlamydiales bacterium]|nr:hypothetical protein [Chlamydiia bacterium]MCP5507040.1 hypothetical protein [Chlamydiales bacterium]